VEAERDIAHQDCGVVELFSQLQRARAPTAVARNRSGQKFVEPKRVKYAQLQRVQDGIFAVNLQFERS
jgi:hypothetical protein